MAAAAAAGAFATRLTAAGSCFRFDLNPARQSHEPAFGGCDCGVRARGAEIKHVYDRAADVFLPGQDDQVIADGDCLILDGIGEADTVTCDYFHGQLAFGVNSDLRREGRETDLEHVAGEKRGVGCEVISNSCST